MVLHFKSGVRSLHGLLSCTRTLRQYPMVKLISYFTVVRTDGKCGSMYCVAARDYVARSGALKMTDMKLQDMKLTDRVAGHEIAGHENGGPNSRT